MVGARLVEESLSGEFVPSLAVATVRREVVLWEDVHSSAADAPGDSVQVGEVEWMANR